MPEMGQSNWAISGAGHPPIVWASYRPLADSQHFGDLTFGIATRRGRAVIKLSNSDFLSGSLQRSDGCRWLQPDVRTFAATKQLFSVVTDTGLCVGCARYCGRRTCTPLVALRLRPFLYLLD